MYMGRWLCSSKCLHQLTRPLILKLFTSFIQLVLLYGVGVWGSFVYGKSRKCEHLKLDEVLYDPQNLWEKFHIKICKQIIGVNKKSSNISALLELGRFPISIKIFKLIYKYTTKILNIDGTALISRALKSPQYWLHESSQIYQQ